VGEYAKATSASTAATSTIDNDDGESPFEGDSSMAAHTAFASDFLEHAVERTSLLDLSPSMAAALESLKQLVSMQNRSSGSSRGSSATTPGNATAQPASRSLPPGGFRDLPMPPLQKVLEILKDMKEAGLGASSMIRCFVSLNRFTDHCRRVYFPADDFSLATFTVVVAGIYYLSEEKAHGIKSDDERAEWLGYNRMARANLELALNHLTIILPARRETVEALLLAESFAIETGRPSVAWALNSTAVLHCLAMGWHRQLPPAMAANVSQEQIDSQGVLFWLAYIMDKGLALRLGRNSIIQDYDITLPKTLGSTLDSNEVWRGIITSWIHHAEAQGRTYEQLYSSRALSTPPEVRMKDARSIAQAIHQLNDSDAENYKAGMQELAAAIQRGEISEEEAKSETFELEGMFKSDQVSHWSTLTLVYRAIPPAPGFPSSFSAECIEAARSAFRMHFECMDLINNSPQFGGHREASYINWTILYNPFVPFIVLFCHVIETSNAEDLERLSNFVKSLESSRATVSSVDKLYKLGQVLYNVATLYVEAKSKQQQDADMIPLGNDVDMYLNALGLMPNVNMNMSTVPDGNAMSGFDNSLPPAELTQAQTAQLGDWFSGNRYMMGLMEEDLPFNWS
jgi:hypothetical protein